MTESKLDALLRAQEKAREAYRLAWSKVDELGDQRTEIAAQITQARIAQAPDLFGQRGLLDVHASLDEGCAKAIQDAGITLMKEHGSPIAFVQEGCASIDVDFEFLATFVDWVRANSAITQGDQNEH